MKTSINISDFTFEFLGRGAYMVVYVSPVTGKRFPKRITDMSLIDATKNADNPKIYALEQLKRLCKG